MFIKTQGRGSVLCGVTFSHLSHLSTKIAAHIAFLQSDELQGHYLHLALAAWQLQEP